MERIVVGVDDSPGAVAALRWALKLADETGAEVEVVHAWELSYAWVNGYCPDLEQWLVNAKQYAQASLDRAMARADDLLRDTKITRTVLEGPAATMLIDRSKNADLLVVGTRGRGGFAGLLLGSVSQQCVHHARVPVVVVPEPE